MLALSDLDIPSDLSSTVPIDILNDSFTESTNIRVNEDIDSSIDPKMLSNSDSHMDEAILIEQLKTLGYID